jgi:multicomponent Na+:H+ antiporter subunit G
MLETFAVPFILVGLVFFFGCVVGLIRFPDFYTRMHAAGKGDTLSTALILIGFALLAIHQEISISTLLVAAKILGICVFIMLTSPTSTHALMRAGYEDGVVPYEGPGQKKKEDS